MFSSTLIEPKVAVIWKVRPTPRRQIWRGVSPAIATPSSAIVPASGASWPFSMLKQVLLPAPFGPISASSSPAASANDTSSTARTPPNALRRLLTSSTGVTARPWKGTTKARRHQDGVPHGTLPRARGIDCRAARGDQLYAAQGTPHSRGRSLRAFVPLWFP
jgi:hypothetical protein